MSDAVQIFLSQVEFSATHLFNDIVCGRSPTHYTGEVGYIHFFQGGKLTVLPQGDIPFTLTQPSIVFYPTAWPHHLHGDEVLGARMQCSVIDYRVGMSKFVKATLPPVIVVPVSQYPELQATLQLLVSEGNSKFVGWRTATERLFEYLMALIIRQLVSTKQVEASALAGFGDANIARSIIAVNDDISGDWDLTKMATLSGMSRSSYSARFLAKMNITPAEYVLRLRLTRAKELLKQGVAVKAVAMQTGFSSAAVIARAFKRHENKSPLAWLKQVKENA